MTLVETVAVVERQVYCRSARAELFVYCSWKSCIKLCNGTQAAVILTERAKRMTLCTGGSTNVGTATLYYRGGA